MCAHITQCMLDEKSAKHLSTVPLSNDILVAFGTTNSFCKWMRTDVACEWISRLAILLIIVRYPYEHSLEEDFLVCTPLPTNTAGKEIFSKINNFFEINYLSWNDYTVICARTTMTGKTVGVVSLIKSKAQNSSSSHCILHSQALSIKKMPPNLKLVLDEAVEIITLNQSLISTGCFQYCVKIMGTDIKHYYSTPRLDCYLGVRS
ncbi:unnamed protein product [Gongylonema pulchrum]|uniref:N-acetyltransferase domain-containing protein n=1 Tax=Gongylonema pulchrum TaxID=637853 RepID=A0A183D1R7_9BILA|nr:unnamed protein product [Gongylonema pulchrum]